MSVYITGYKGYIGASLAEYLAEREYDVRGIGRGHRLPTTFGYRDVIVNCACSGWKDGDEDPVDLVESNIVLPLEIDKRRNGAVMIHMSSGIEDLQPLHPYARTKGVATHMLRNKAHVLRLYAVFGGKHVQMTRFMSSLMQACKDHAPYVIRTPNHTRDFVHIDRLMNLVENLMENRAYSTLDVGCGRPISFLEAFETLKKVSGRNFQNVEIDGSDDSEMMYRAMDPCLPDTFEADVAKEWRAIHA